MVLKKGEENLQTENAGTWTVNNCGSKRICLF